MNKQKKRPDEAYERATKKNSYEQARDDLEIAPYSERMRSMFNFLLYFRSVYHFMSVLLGIATCVLIAILFSGVGDQSGSGIPIWLLAGIGIIVGAILVGILVGIEMRKAGLAKSISQRRALRKKNGVASIVALCVLVLVSIALSGVGGALVSFKTSDKSKVISENYKGDKSRISGKYNKEIAHNKQVVRSFELLAINRQKRAWGLTKDEQKNLNNARAQVKRLGAAKIKESESAKGTYNNQVLQNTDSTSQTMLIAIILITIMELITIYAYVFHYQYQARTESEGRVLGMLLEQKEEVYEQDLHEQPQDLNEAVQVLGGLLSQVLGNTSLTSLAESYQATVQKSAAGFGKFWQEQDLKSKRKASGQGKSEKDYQDLIEDIRQGERHMPTLTHRHKVNIKTVNALIKKHGSE